MKKIILISLGVIICAALGIGFYAYNKIYNNYNIGSKDKERLLFLPKDANFNSLKDSLYSNFSIDQSGFELTAKLKNFSSVKPGCYLIKEQMSNNDLVNMLRSGNQTPVNVTFNNLKTIDQLCKKIASQLDINQDTLKQLLNDDNYLKSLGFNKENISSLFIPNTYQFYWNTSERNFLKRMKEIYNQFWTNERQAKADKLKMSRLEVITLASIVQSEQAVHKDEQPVIAGLYLNRIKEGMPLQSDPTIIFAIGDFEIKRVTHKMLEIDSPYNTYKNLGLPPSPICFVETSAIDAVLNHQENNYIYMCAKEDLSGKHNFTRNYNEHLNNAHKFQKALDQRNIK